MTETPSTRMTEIIRLLLEQTRRGSASWRRSDLTDAFVLGTRSGSVVVEGPGARIVINGGPPYRIRVLDGGGQLLEQFPGSSPDVLLGGIPYLPLKELHELIVARVRDGNPDLDRVLQDLRAS